MIPWLIFNAYFSASVHDMIHGKNGNGKIGNGNNGNGKKGNGKNGNR